MNLGWCTPNDLQEFHHWVKERTRSLSQGETWYRPEIISWAEKEDLMNMVGENAKLSNDRYKSDVL